MNPAPIVRDVVLVGGGHAHALLIRQWAMRPLPGVRLTLVSEDCLTPYSGMLPGLVAGHYTVDEVHIDLLRLCAWAGVRFIEARMTSIDPDAREIALRGRPAIGYDLLSLDTGSTPDLTVPGAREHATPVKPVHDFHKRWRSTVDRLPVGEHQHARAAHRCEEPETGGTCGKRAVPETCAEPLDVGVVGSGAGGFEILMAVRHALPARVCRTHWFLRGDKPLAGRPPRVGELALAAAEAAGVVLHRGVDVAEVRAGPTVVARDGAEVLLDELLWCTGATGPRWPANSGLETDDRGFVATDAYLRSRSHPDIFAVGDIGTQLESPAPKAGVHAVRQAPVLHDNLRAALLGEALRVYRPQADFLSLMATGGQHAIANRGPFTVAGDWVWRWKDSIDRKFMKRFVELPPMTMSSLPSILPDALLADAGDPLRCKGCGAKVGAELLDEVLAGLPPFEAVGYADQEVCGEAHSEAHSEAATSKELETGREESCEAACASDRLDDNGIITGLTGPDGARDAAVLDPGNRLLVQSVDQLSSIVDDPWRFGRIAVLHALSDVLTVDASPHSAQVTIVLPAGADRVQRRELRQLFDGIIGALHENGIALVGGHTAEGSDLQVGVVVNAFATRPSTGGRDLAGSAKFRPRSVQQQGIHAAEPGDRLILTRPLGTGVLFAGLMRTQARGEDISKALDTMGVTQRRLAELLRGAGALAMTDITGFGLAGHLERLLRPCRLRACVSVDAIPWFDGALRLAEQGVHSSLYAKNRSSLDFYDGAAGLPESLRILLADPQTAGGLLAIMPATRADAALASLAECAPASRIIGRLTASDTHSVELGSSHQQSRVGAAGEYA